MLNLGLGKPEPGKQSGKACHRFRIPMSVAAPDKLGNVALHGQMAFIDCIGEKCNLYNAEAKECHDVTAAKASTRLCNLVEQIDGLLRMPEEKS
jgi:hypothetical protein